jgi:hypothetical protein
MSAFNWMARRAAICSRRVAKMIRATDSKMAYRQPAFRALWALVLGKTDGTDETERHDSRTAGSARAAAFLYVGAVFRIPRKRVEKLAGRYGRLRGIARLEASASSGASG